MHWFVTILRSYRRMDTLLTSITSKWSRLPQSVMELIHCVQDFLSTAKHDTRIYVAPICHSAVTLKPFPELCGFPTRIINPFRLPPGKCHSASIWFYYISFHPPNSNWTSACWLLWRFPSVGSYRLMRFQCASFSRWSGTSAVANWFAVGGRMCVTDNPDKSVSVWCTS